MMSTAIKFAVICIGSFAFLIDLGVAEENRGKTEADGDHGTNLGSVIFVSAETGESAVMIDEVWHLLDFGKLTPSSVACVFTDREGRCWIGGAGGVACLAGEEVHLYDEKNGLPSGTISHIGQDSAGRIWASSWGDNIASFENDRWRKWTVADGLCFSDVNGVAEGTDKQVWIGTDQGVSIFKDGSFVQIDLVQQLSNLNVKSIADDGKGRIFLGAIGGVVIIDSDLRTTIVSPEEGLPQRTSQALLVDSQERIWAGTWGGGVVQIDHENLTIRKELALPEAGYIGRICEDSEKAIWVASLNTGLWRLQGAEWARVEVPAGVSHLRVVTSLTLENANALKQWAAP